MLPKVIFKKKFAISDISNKDNFFTVRRTNFSYDNTFNEIGNLRDDVITSNDVANMSMNLLGKAFRLSYLVFISKGRASEYWQGDQIFLSEYIDLIKREEQFIPILYNLTDLHNIQIPAIFTATKDQKKWLRSKNVAFTEGLQEFDMKAKICVEHAPTNINYWHVELKLIDVNGDIVKKTNTRHTKAIQFILDHILTMKPLKQIPSNFYEIENSLFMN